MNLLVTRPEPQASEWARRLNQAGVTAQPLPLIAIEAPPDGAAVERLWRTLPEHRALMFVSPAAVSWFFRLRPDGLAWPQACLACAPGPGTAQALLEAGAAHGLTDAHIVSPAHDAPQFDSEALWPLLAPLDWRDQNVAIVSGGDAQSARGRQWLSEQWRAQGARIEAIQAYQRSAGRWDEAQQRLALAALTQPQRHTWLLSSSQALDFLLDVHLPAFVPALVPACVPAHSDPQDMQLLCTHPRIAEHALARGLRHIAQCAPTLQAVVQARRSSP